MRRALMLAAAVSLAFVPVAQADHVSRKPGWVKDDTTNSSEGSRIRTIRTTKKVKISIAEVPDVNKVFIEFGRKGESILGEVSVDESGDITLEMPYETTGPST